MRFASLKMTTINPMSNQITVIIRIADYIEVYWSSKNFISVCLNRGYLAGMLIDFNIDC